MTIIRPVVLCLSGHDPCGGAGIQADIEVLVSHHCHAASVITALTEQDTFNVKKVFPQSVDAFTAQVRTVLTDLPVKVIKIGLIGDYQLAVAIHELLVAHPNIPVVLDPILAAGGGTVMANQSLRQVIAERLVPCAHIVTPNSVEARQLTQLHDLDACGRALLEAGCHNVLITGAHEETQLVSNRLFQKDQPVQTFSWERLPGHYHGSGCTLATSIAALLAHGLDAFVAANEAQEYTWNALQAAYQTGQGQLNPNRFFWIENENAID